MHRFRDWADLPWELVEIFMNKLDLPGLFKFTHICSSWRSVSSPIFKSKVESLLILEEDFYDNGSVRIYNPLDGIPYQVRLPSGFTKGNICGSENNKSLVLDDQGNGNHISLLHLFSSTAADAIHLFPLPIKCEKWKKICLSSDQSMAMAMAITAVSMDDEDEDVTTFNIFICNTKQDLSWNHIEFPHSTHSYKPLVADVIFSKGKFYAITTDRVIVIVDASLDDGGLATHNKGYETLVSCAQAPFPLIYYDESLDYNLIYVTMAVAHQPKRRVSNIVLKNNAMDENYEYASKQFERAYGTSNHSVFVKCDHYRIILTQLISNLMFSP